MQHTHGPNCGCIEYVGAQNANDLYGVIDIQKVRCLNEQTAGSGKSIIKAYQDRFDKTKYVASDCDGQLLLIIPFTSQVKIRSICIIAKSQNNFPNLMKLHINSQNVDFSLTQSTPIQQFIIPANLTGQINNAVKVNKFSSVHKLIIHMKNQSQDRIQVAYLQIKGENTNIKRQAVQAVYEVQPNAQKKDIKDFQKNTFQMG